MLAVRHTGRLQHGGLGCVEQIQPQTHQSKLGEQGIGAEPATLGVGLAAQCYCDKPVQRLTLAESAITGRTALLGAAPSAAVATSVVTAAPQVAAPSSPARSRPRGSIRPI